MDTVLLFALPLVGGLIFSSHWNFTRFRVAREDGHRLYFRAVFYGALLFAATLTIRYYTIEFVPRYALLEAQAKSVLSPLAKDKDVAPAVAELAITCFYSMLAGLPLALLLNIGFRQKQWLRRSVKNDDFESLLLKALERKSALAVSMDDGKVYVGFVVNTFDPTIIRKTFSLLPLISGFRRENDHKVEFTTFYTEIYGVESADAESLPPPLDHLSPADFVTVLPVDGIVSSRLFDFDAYLAFNTDEGDDKTG